MVTIKSHNFTSTIDPKFFLSSYKLSGTLTLSEGKAGDTLLFTTEGFGFNDGTTVRVKGSDEPIATIAFLGQSSDVNFSHTSDNPPITETSSYRLRLDKDISEDTTVYLSVEGSVNHSMTNKPYPLTFKLSEGREPASSLRELHKKEVTIPTKNPEQPVVGFLLGWTNITYVEGEWDGRLSFAHLWASGTALPAGTILELNVPSDHLEVLPSLTVGTKLTGPSQSYVTGNSRVNSHGVYQRDPNDMEYEVTEVSPTKIVVKTLRDTLPSNKYIVNMPGYVKAKDLEGIYNATDNEIEDVFTGVVKNSSGTRISTSREDKGSLVHIVKKKNSRADVPYKAPPPPLNDPVLAPPPPPPKEVKPTPVQKPLAQPPCMGCSDCTECECRPADVLTQRTYKQLDEKLDAFLDLMCAIMDVDCLDLPKFLAKFIYMLWCLIRDLIEQIRCLHARTDALMCVMRTMPINSSGESYDQAMYRYYQEEKAFSAKVEELKAKQGEEGYLASNMIQSMVVKDEPNAKLAVTLDGQPVGIGNFINGVYYYQPRESRYVHYDGNGLKSYTLKGIKPGGVLELTYFDLQNSYYNGKPIGSIKMTMTNNTRYRAFFNIFPDPTMGVWGGWEETVMNGGWKQAYSYKFYDKGGQQIEFSEDAPALIALSGISVDDKGYHEVISNYNFKYVPINGSVAVEREGRIYSTHRPPGYVDVKGHPTFYKQGAAGLITSGNEITFELSSNIAPNYGNNSMWITFNTDVDAPVAIKPTPPPAMYFMCGEEPNCGGK